TPVKVLDARGLRLPIQYLDRSLLFGLEFGRLLIAKLGVDKSVKRLRRAHSVQLIHRRRVNGVWLAAVVANGVADQQPAILLVKIADPHFDQLGSRSEEHTSELQSR